MQKPAYSLAEIVARFGGKVLGNAETSISQIATLDSATSGQIAFLANSKYRAQLEATQAGAVILAAADADATATARIVCDNPYAYFARLSAFLNPQPQANAGIHPSAVIGEGASIADSAQIDAHVVIGAGARIGAHSIIMSGCAIGPGVVIGERALLYPRVVVYHDCTLGNNLIAHSGVVIGADGFGIAMEQGRWLKIPQIGRVVIGNDVEIGANTTIDRELAPRGVGRPGRASPDDVPARHPAARLSGPRGRLDLHVLADPGRLHHAGPGRGREVHRERHLRQLEPWQSPARGRLLDDADRDHDRLPARRPAPRRVRVAVMAQATR